MLLLLLEGRSSSHKFKIDKNVSVFYFNFLIVHMHIEVNVHTRDCAYTYRGRLCVHKCRCMQRSEVIKSSGVRVIGDCKTSDVGARNQTGVFCNSSKFSYLKSHLLLLVFHFYNTVLHV